MEDKNKRKLSGGVRIILLLAVLSIAVGIYFGLTVYNDRQAEEEDASTEMLSVKTSDVVSFTYELNGVNYTFEREDSKSDWIYVQDPSLELDQDTVTDMLSTGTSVSAKTIIADNLENASEYGLENPAFTLSMNLKDGTVKTICVGALNSMTSEYYSYIEGDERIFTVEQDFMSSFTTAEELASASSMEESSISAY